MASKNGYGNVGNGGGPSKNGFGNAGNGDGEGLVEISDPDESLRDEYRFTRPGYDSDTETTDEKDDGVGEGGPSDFGTEMIDTGSDQDLENIVDYLESTGTSGDSTSTSDDDSNITITNGVAEFVGALSMTFDDSGLPTEFDTYWVKLREVESLERGTGLSKFEYIVIDQQQYEAVINADYEIGITPYKITTVSEDSENISSVIGWSHGNIERPSFDKGRLNAYDITYSTDEIEKLKEDYQKDSFSENITNSIESLSLNIFNRMNINLSQNFEFQKSKQKQIKYKNISIFETQQETIETTMERASVVTQTSVNNGGY